MQPDQVLSPLSISVIIPVYNGGESFRKCLESLEQSDRKPDQIIVVADGDTDGSWKVAETFGVKVIRYQTSGGPARARNRGAEAAEGDILFFVDADVTVHKDTILLLENAFQSNSELDALIGSYDDSPGADNFLSQYKNLFHHYTHQVSSENGFTFWGACGAIRKSVFCSMGGFDECYSKPCIEDIELGYRLKAAGHSIRLYKNIQVKHLKEWKPASLLKAEVFYRALPWVDLLLENQKFDADLNLSNSNRVSVFLVFALLAGFFLSTFFSIGFAIAVISVVGLLLINRDVYFFFYRQRGILFTLRVIPWHWLYFLYGGGSFAYGLLRFLFRRLNFPVPPTIVEVPKSRQISERRQFLAKCPNQD